MPHRAAEIIDQIADILNAQADLAAVVYTHRQLTLSESDQEVPAVIVQMGDDEPFTDTGVSVIPFIDSLLDVTCTLKATGVDEPEIMGALLELRRQVHIALMADRSLGLGFVIDTRYQGATQPEIERESERMVGSYATRWTVHYRMNILDPS